MSSALARGAVALVAVAAVVWLALGLHASQLANDGRGGAKAPATPKRLDDREVARRQSLLQRSLAHNADTDPLVREAALLAFAGKPEEGLPLLREVVDREPENYEAWGQITVAAQKVDPALSRRARARALALNPRAGR